MADENLIYRNSSFTLNQKTLINPIDLGTRIKSGYINDKITIIKKNTIEINDSTNDFIIKNQTTNYIEIDTSNNIVNINVPLKLTTIISNDLYTFPIIKYNIISENIQNFEKKYIAKTSIINGNGVVQYYFKNIIDNIDEQITFRGKIISRDLTNNSASFIFDGFTKYIDPTDTNHLEFELNTLFTSDIEWKINTFFIDNTDLVIEVQSNQTTTTNWIVSIESISV